MMILFYSKPFFERKKLSFDDFLMTTWEQKNKSKRKKEPEIQRLGLFLNNSRSVKSNSYRYFEIVVILNI